MTRILLYYAPLSCLLAIVWLSCPNLAAGAPTPRLEEAWELFHDKSAAPKQARPARPEAATSDQPGRRVGKAELPAGLAASTQWRYRAVNYELYFASSGELARAIYGPALFVGDINESVALERFERGVQGFHYGVEQLCPWLQAVLTGQAVYRTAEENRLANWLLADGVLEVRAGKVVPGRSVKHVSGAAAGKKRTLEVNLRHERLHVLWDEDEAFRESSLSAWRALSPAEQEQARLALSSYAQDNEAQLIEEWAVFKAEKLPERERMKLVGL